MTTSRVDLLAGVDMEGGENFCDSIYNFLKNQGKDINLLTNSGFGVWSQSDAAKGLALVPYNTGSAGGGDEPDVGDAALGATSGATGKIISFTIAGSFATNNANGVLTLGAVTGTFQTGETINFTDGETAIVGADANIGVKNDPMNDNSTGIWTRDAGLNLGFGAALYTVDTNAVNLRAWITAGATLVAGKIYKIELDINDGVVNTKGVQGYFDDGAAQYGRTRTTGAGFVSYSWTFECATSTAAGKVGFRIVENLGGGGQNIQIRRFSCYEITPCCTNDADNKAFDGWYKNTTVDIYRQHWDATYSKCGSFYSLKIVPGHADDYVRFPGAFYDNEEWYKQFCGQPVTVGAWVYASVANHAKLVIQQTSGDTSSAYHTGTPGWEWLEVTEEIATNTIFFDIQLYCTLAPDVDGTTIVYISQDMLVFGWSLGEGMYQPRLQEWIYCIGQITSNGLHGASGLSSDVDVPMNLEADSDGKIPKGAKAALLRSIISDTGSAANNTSPSFICRSSPIAGYTHSNYGPGKKDNSYSSQVGPVACNENGDYIYSLSATAAGTLDVVVLYYTGVQVT